MDETYKTPIKASDLIKEISSGEIEAEVRDDVAKKNPFVIKYEMNIPPCGDWEKCSEVLGRKEKIIELSRAW